MRQTIAFQATGFDCSPVQVQVEEDAGEIDESALPVALLAFESGPNVVLTLPLATSDGESMMNAFTQAEPYRQAITDAGNWQPQPSGLPEGLFWALQPSVVGVSVTPPQQTAEGLVPQARWGTPRDVGLAVAAVLGGQFPFSTGEVFHIDGGAHLRRL